MSYNKSFANYINFIIQKLIIEIIIGLVIRKYAAYINVIGEIAK